MEFVAAIPVPFCDGLIFVVYYQQVVVDEAARSGTYLLVRRENSLEMFWKAETMVENSGNVELFI